RPTGTMAKRPDRQAMGCYQGHMALARQSRSGGSWLRQAMLVAIPLTMLGVAGCAQVRVIKSKVNGNPTTVPAPVAQPETRRASSFTAIVNELQLGHYDEGEKDLRQ